MTHLLWSNTFLAVASPGLSPLAPVCKQIPYCLQEVGLVLVAVWHWQISDFKDSFRLEEMSRCVSR